MIIVGNIKVYNMWVNISKYCNFQFKSYAIHYSALHNHTENQIVEFVSFCMIVDKIDFDVI